MDKAPSEVYVEPIEGGEDSLKDKNDSQAAPDFPEMIVIKEERSSDHEDHFMNTLESKIVHGTESNLEEVAQHPGLIFRKEIKQECDYFYDEHLNECNSESRKINTFEFVACKEEVSDDSTNVKVEVENDNEMDHEDEIETDALATKSEDECTNLEGDKGSKRRYKRVHKCTECEYTTNQKHHLKRHLMIHKKNTVQKFSCQYCDFCTIYKNSLNHHILKHSTIKPFQCQFCSQDFNRKRYYKLHMNIHHPEECQEKMKSFQCNKCEYNTMIYTNFARHRLKHGDTENLTKYNCPLCEYSTFDKSVLKRHSLRHSGDKPFACKHCDYSCRTSTNLKSHVNRRHKNSS